MLMAVENKKNGETPLKSGPCEIDQQFLVFLQRFLLDKVSGKVVLNIKDGVMVSFHEERYHKLRQTKEKIQVLR